MKPMYLFAIAMAIAVVGCQKEIKEIRGHSDSPVLAQADQ